MRTSKEDLASCLRDCGVQPETVEQIARGSAHRILKDHTARRQLCLLGKERSSLLENLHQAQRRLDLMDLLIYLLQNEEKETKER